MEVKGVTPAQFQTVVAQVSTARYDGNVIVGWGKHSPSLLNSAGTRWRGRVVVQSSKGKGARRSASGRRTPSACWHVFRDVFRALFAQYPDAAVKTSMARYTAATFEHTYPQTGKVNVGSMFAPAYMPELCECDDWDEPVTVGSFSPVIVTKAAPVKSAPVVDTFVGVENALQGAIPALWTAKAACPHAGCGTEDCVRTVIIHLNDQHLWKREAIADWLDTLDIDLRFTA